jgi:hypothetical protein
MAPYFAVLEVAAWLAHLSLGLPWEYQGTIANLWQEITADSGEADRAAVALRNVVSWANSRSTQFVSGTIRNTASVECLGRWRVVPRESSANECIAIYPHKLDECLRALGFDPATIRRQWHDRRWLNTSPGKLTYKVRVPGSESPHEMVAIRWAAIRDIVGVADE